MKIVSIVGARPQFIKAAPVSFELSKKHEEFILHTGQHYDEKLSKIFFEDLKIPRPNINLDVGSDTQARQTAEMMIGIEKVLLNENPDLVLIYGDTNSTLAGALAASKLRIKIAHVEAGLRSFNRKMSEEINRIVADKISNYLFCPTETAVKNLAKEGVTQGVHNVGDVMLDAALKFAPIAESKSSVLQDLCLKPRSYFLLTLHRAENTGFIERMKSIVNALIDSKQTIIFPVHPRTLKYLKLYDLMHKLQHAQNIKFLEPLSFLDMIVLEKNAAKVITDSGGVQKEAYFYQIPCITLRDETEWVETVEDGWNVIVGAEYEKILAAITNFEPKGSQRGHYGNGKASEKLREIIEAETN